MRGKRQKTSLNQFNLNQLSAENWNLFLIIINLFKSSIEYGLSQLNQFEPVYQRFDLD